MSYDETRHELERLRALRAEGGGTVKKTRLEFVLSMPGSPTWNGRWSGEGRHYAVVRVVPDIVADALLKGKESAYWHYAWPDGWAAGITAHRLAKGERAKKSVGFSGYEWMVTNILSTGTPYHPAPAAPEKKEAV